MKPIERENWGQPEHWSQLSGLLNYGRPETGEGGGRVSSRNSKKPALALIVTGEGSVG